MVELEYQLTEIQNEKAGQGRWFVLGTELSAALEIVLESVLQSVLGAVLRTVR